MCFFVCGERKHQTSDEASNAVRVIRVRAIASSVLKLVLTGSKQASLVFKHPNTLVCFIKCRQKRRRSVLMQVFSNLNSQYSGRSLSLSSARLEDAQKIVQDPH